MKISKYMTMREAFQCGDDDKPYIEDGFNCTLTYTKKQILQKQRPETDPCTVFKMVKDSLSDKWQVQKAEPKVLTVEECFKKYSIRQMEKDFAPGRDYFHFGFGDGKGQGRLERDLEVRPVVKAIQKYQNDDSIEFHESGIFEALENLKPLNDE